MPCSSRRWRSPCCGSERTAGGARDSEYVERGGVEDRLRDALGSSAFVLVFGPPRAGKSRTAFEAARRTLGDAVVVAPRDADGLRQLLELDPPLLSRRSRVPRWSRSARAVLWLDGLPRYLEAFDANVLDDLRAGRIPVTVVATIREDEYDALLGGSGPEAEAAKVVVGAARAFELPADGLGARRSSTGKEEQAPPPAAAERAAGRVEPAVRDPLYALPAGLAAAVVVVIGLIAVTSGLEQPTPLSLAQQADQLLRGAGTQVFGPVQADLHGTGEKSQLFVAAPEASEDAANGASVPPSHEIRIYDPRGDELVERFRFRPDVDGAVFQYRDLDALSGSSGEKLVGGYGFPTEANRALLPFALYWDGGSGEYRIKALQDEPPKLSRGVKPKPAARPYLNEYRERVTLRDSDEDVSLSGYRVQDFSITHDPDRLVSAVATDPKTDEPGRVEVRGSIVSFPGGEPTLIGCRFQDGRPLLGSLSPDRDLQFELIDHWRPYIATRDCNPAL